MSKLIALRLLGEAVALAISRALLNRLTLFHDRSPDQVIDFLRPIDHEQLREFFAFEQERVASFWTVKAEDDVAEFLVREWDLVAGILERLPFLSEEELEEFRGLDATQLRARLGMPSERIVAFWKVKIAFRLEQRGRLDLAREFLGRMYHNALIVEQWATSQWFYQKRYGEHDEITAGQLAIMKALRGKAKQFRMLTLAALIRIWFRCLLPFHETRFLPIPSVAALRTVLRYDLLAAYEEVKNRAIALGRLNGEELARELALKM